MDAFAVSAASRTQHGIEVQVRIGLNSGEVIVLGIGDDLHMDYDAIGATVHLAARMEQAASPIRYGFHLIRRTLSLVE
jgi:class 3 adenylate cyclase